MPNNPHEPTEVTRAQVSSLSAFGVSQEDICKVIGVSINTLYKYYREELDTAATKAIGQVAQSLFKQAMAGNVTAQIFFLKTRAGWREKSDLNVVSEDGSMSPPDVIELVPVDPKKDGAD